MSRDIDQEIRDHWFNDHVATLTKHGDLEVLRWKKPETGTYSCRYIFDGNKIYVSGDIGEAVFCLTEKSDVHTCALYNIGYFEGKLRAYSEDRRDFNNDKAVSRLREWLKDIKEDEQKYDHDDMRDLFDEARNCNSHSEWAEIVHSHEDFISDLDTDYRDWMYNCGDEIPIRIKGYLIGLKMASEQLKSVKIEGEIK